MFNLDYEKSTIEIIFWLWVRSKENPYPLKDYIDIRGATALEMGGVFVDTLESEGELFYLTQAEIHAEILSAFDDSRYPLDDQHVELVIEFTHFFAEDVTVRLAEDDLAVNPEYLQTWRITNIQSSIFEAQSESTFGYFTNKANAYKALKVEYDLTRRKFPLFIKVFFVVFISFFLAAISFFLPNSKSEEKISLIIGALFTAIGNLYIVSAQTGERPELGLIDEIHLTTFSFLLFFSVMAIIEQRKDWKNNLKFDAVLFCLSTLLYSMIVAYRVFKH